MQLRPPLIHGIFCFSLLALPAPPGQPADNKVDSLIRQLGSSKFTEREAADAKLEQLGETAVPALKCALKSDAPEIRRRAARLVMRIRDQAQVRTLIRALKDPHECVRARAASGLADIDRPAVPFLLDLLEGKDKSLRAQAAWVLHLMGSMGQRHRETLPNLTRALQDGDKEVRTAVAAAIDQIVIQRGKVPDKLIPALIEALKDKDERVRAYARDALSSLDSAAVPALIQLLEGKDDALRASAAQILGSMGAQGRRHPKAIPLLKDAEQSQNEKVRHMARSALHWIAP